MPKIVYPTSSDHSRKFSHCCRFTVDGSMLMAVLFFLGTSRGSPLNRRIFPTGLFRWFEFEHGREIQLSKFMVLSFICFMSSYSHHQSRFVAWKRWRLPKQFRRFKVRGVLKPSSRWLFETQGTSPWHVVLWSITRSWRPIDQSVLTSENDSRCCRRLALGNSWFFHGGMLFRTCHRSLH